MAVLDVLLCIHIHIGPKTYHITDISSFSIQGDSGYYDSPSYLWVCTSLEALVSCHSCLARLVLTLDTGHPFWVSTTPSVSLTVSVLGCFIAWFHSIQTLAWYSFIISFNMGSACSAVAQSCRVIQFGGLSHMTRGGQALILHEYTSARAPGPSTAASNIAFTVSSWILLFHSIPESASVSMLDFSVL